MSTRYFKTSNASRPYNAGGLAFTFESVQQSGGNWLGVLAVDDESAAGLLAGAAYPQVTEITADDFDGIKKKPKPSVPSYVMPPQEPQRPVSPPPAPSAEKAQELPVLPEPQAADLDVPDELAKTEQVKPVKASPAKKP